MRKFLSETGLSRIKNLNDDDTLITNDCDELPAEEVTEDVAAKLP